MIVRVAVNEIIICPVTVKIAHPDEMNLAARLDIDDPHILRGICRERIAAIGFQFLAVHHSLDGVAVIFL